MENEKKIKVELKEIPETMLIPLRARYLESKKKNGIIYDEKSIEILNSINYDFKNKKEVSQGSQIGTAIRTEILDEQTKQFLKNYPDGTVVNLGCGLDTRYYRLNNKKVHWFDLDVPESIELRKNFFNENEKFNFISKSVLDFTWIELIPKDKPTLFIAEGLLMYFTEDEVKTILKQISDNFMNAEIILESISPAMVKRSKQHPDLKDYNAVFKWGIKSGKKIEDWNIGLKFINEWYYFDRHLDKFPFYFRILAKIPAFRKMMKIIKLHTQ